jgi:DNA modification methylase
MNRLSILTGDCRDILPTLEAGSVQCCVTSPPYWGLRDYGTAQWEGGEAGCEHKLTHEGSVKYVDGHGKLNVSCTSWQGGSRHSTVKEGGDCPKCGARRIDSQLGLEATPEEYIANMVAVFREVWRVLRDDGTLWVNMGDCYSSGNSGQNVRDNNGGFQPGLNSRTQSYTKANPGRKPVPGMKPKDLCMMPARLAMALQADGWYLRSEIVWHKPNPMPESVTDRPTKAHEMIYLLAKQERYFYDAEAIKEQSTDPDDDRKSRSDNGNKRLPEDIGVARMGGIRPGSQTYALRNKRTVWTIATQPYAEAHFATFPEEIPKLCILAGSKPGDTVLDPFAGSGTVGKVALELGRRAILIELNPSYIELAEDRTFVTPGFL